MTPADFGGIVSPRSTFTPGPAYASDARVGSVIFCLTRDRPQTLIHALNAISIDLKKAKLRPRAFIVLDDSVTAQCRSDNAHIMERIAKEAHCVCLYHGAAEQNKLLVFIATRWGPDAKTFDLFFRRLGGLKWDLGGVRSYAMVLANLIGKSSSPIVMIDDDIVILPQARSGSAIVTLEQDVLDNPRLLTGGIIKDLPTNQASRLPYEGYAISRILKPIFCHLKWRCLYPAASLLLIAHLLTCTHFHVGIMKTGLGWHSVKRKDTVSA